MSAVHVPAADMDRRDNDTVRGNRSHKIADSRDVRDGVHGPHFVEVDLRHRHAVRPALGIRDEPVDREDIVLHSVLDVQPIDNGLDVCHGCVVMAVGMMMVMVVTVVMLMLVVVVMIMAIVVVMLMLVVMVVAMAMMVAVLMVVAMVMPMGVAMMVAVLMALIMFIMMLSITQQVSLQDTIDFYTDVSAGDAALDRRCGLEPDTGYTNRVQFSHAFIFIRNNF